MDSKKINFKTGDKIRFLEDGSDYELGFSRDDIKHGDTPFQHLKGSKDECIGEVVKVNGERCLVKYTIKGREMQLSFGKNEIELFKRGKGRSPRVPVINFLLKYDLHEDPTEEFETRADALKRVKELLKDKDRNGLKLDSIYIYEIKSKSKVEIINNLKVSKIK